MSTDSSANVPSEATSLPPAQKQNERAQQLDTLLLRIGGLEVSIRDALERRDFDLVKELKALKPGYYEQLRRVTYGLTPKRA
jgi:hypothetical protein